MGLFSSDREGAGNSMKQTALIIRLDDDVHAAFKAHCRGLKKKKTMAAMVRRFIKREIQK